MGNNDGVEEMNRYAPFNWTEMPIYSAFSKLYIAKQTMQVISEQNIENKGLCTIELGKNQPHETISSLLVLRVLEP